MTKSDLFIDLFLDSCVVYNTFLYILYIPEYFCDLLGSICSKVAIECFYVQLALVHSYSCCLQPPCVVLSFAVFAVQ